MALYTVYGCKPATKLRYAGLFEADTPRAAEDAARQLVADNDNEELWVCAVVDDKIATVDLYTLYVDPNDRRNAAADDVVADELDSEVSDYTVLGLIRDHGETRWNRHHHGQRWNRTIPALSPLSAEDVAQSLAKEEGAELWVCAVLPGKIARVDSYGHFVDPDMTLAAKS